MRAGEQESRGTGEQEKGRRGGCRASAYRSRAYGTHKSHWSYKSHKAYLPRLSFPITHRGGAQEPSRPGIGCMSLSKIWQPKALGSPQGV